MPKKIVHIPWEWPVGPSGSAGPAWDLAVDPVSTGTAGSDGHVRLEKALDHEISAQLSAPFVSILLNEACRDYWNRQWMSASQRLDWLSRHLEVLTSPAQYRSRAGLDDAFVLPTTEGPDFAQYRDAHVRVSALRAQLRLGLDYFGEPERFVTLMSPEWFARTVERMLKLASDLEDAHVSYAKAVDEAEATASALSGLEAVKLGLVEQLGNDKRELVKQCQVMMAGLEPLSHARDVAWQDMTAREHEFREAVEAGAGCSFEQLLVIAAACATLYATGGTSVGSWLALAGALGDANDELDLDDVHDDAESENEGYDVEEFKATLAKTMGLVKTVREAVSTTKDFQNAQKAFGQLLEPQVEATGSVRVPIDDAKILTSAEALDSQIKPFLAKLGEAQALKDAVHRFVEICVARNNQLLVLVAAGEKLRALESQVKKTRQEAGVLKDRLQAGDDPRLPMFAVFLEGAWRDSLAPLVRMHHRMQASFGYYTLDDSLTLPLDDFSVNAIKAATSKWHDNYANAMIQAGQEPPTISALRISLADMLGGAQLEELSQSKLKRLTFSVPPDFPVLDTLCKVRIWRIDVTMTTASGPVSDFSIQLLHHGHALQFDENGKPHVHLHSPVRLPFVRQGGRVAVTSQSRSENYLGLSPYGPWTLYLQGPVPAEPIHDVVLELYGSGVARNIHGGQAPNASEQP